MTDTPRGYKISDIMVKKSLIERLNIVGGQVQGLKKLVESEEDCRKVITQFKAADSALRKTLHEYLRENMNSCLCAVDEKDREKIEDLMADLVEISN